MSYGDPGRDPRQNLIARVKLCGRLLVLGYFWFGYTRTEGAPMGVRFLWGTMFAVGGLFVAAAVIRRKMR